ncbi:MAG: S-layer homology domain-containing protein [Oscillospiraceae bacterium]|nr:S-layer homology domain-containing protein [Oscillospiraceae bacterium]
MKYHHCKKFVSILLMVCMLSQISQFAFAREDDLSSDATTSQIVDDYSHHWAAEPIEYLLSREILVGYNNGEIRPANKITRAEFITLVNRAFHFVEESPDNFPDIAGDEWYAAQFKRAKQRGYIAGDEHGRANPEKEITRAEVVVLFTNMLNISASMPVSKFVDADQTPTWAFPSLLAMEERAYIFGYPDNTFRPLRDLTRAEACAIIARIRQIILSDPDLSAQFDLPDEEIPQAAPPSTSPPRRPVVIPDPDPTPDPDPEPTPSRPPLPPHLAIAVSGELRENRKLTISGVSSTGDDAEYQELIRDGDVSLTIRPVDASIPPGLLIRVDGDTARDDYNELIIKQAGAYEITLHYEGPRGSANAIQYITVAPDMPPVPDFSFNTINYRDEGTTIRDASVTERGDDIAAWHWTVIHDKDASGVFSEENAERFETEEGLLAYIAREAGFYQVSLTVEETFNNTISKFLTEDDFLSASSAPKVFEIKNRAPSVAGAIEKAKQLNIAATFGSIAPSREVAFGEALGQVVKNLEDRGALVTLSGISDIFNEYDEWIVYEHQNYRGAYNNPRVTWPRENSIFFEGDDIWMDGYTNEAYKDFLFMPSDDPEEKTLSFDMWRDRTDWHSMEGGGFLFNTHIDAETNTIEGYAMLVTSNGLRVFKINESNLTHFRNGAHPTTGAGTGNGMAAYGQLLTTVNIGTGNALYERHAFRMVISPTTISIWHNENLVLDNYRLPVEAKGYGFGPITAHASHGCSQLSYFTFSDLRMGFDESETLADVLDKYEWTPGAGRAIVHISDGAVKDLSDETAIGSIAAGINRQGVDYFAVSIPESQDAFTDLLRNLVSGHALDGEDVEVFVEELTELLWAKLTTDPLTHLLTADDKIYYDYLYADPEDDSPGEIAYLYSHYISSFPVNTGLIDGNGVLGDSREALGKVGNYDIYLSVSDIPGTNESLAGAYSRWSELTYVDSLTVHRRPVALLSGSLSLGAEGSGHAVLKLTENSYDPDHLYLENKGIVETEWKWKTLSDLDWTDGRPPSVLPYEDEYLVYYRVKDEEGAWSVPACNYFSTLGMTPVVVGPDTEPPVISFVTYNAQDWENLFETDVFNVGEQIWLEASAVDDTSVESFALYVEGQLLSRTYGRNLFAFETPGLKMIEAIARDPSGNEARETLTLTVLGIDNTLPEIILHSPEMNKTVTGAVDVVASITDNVQVASWKLEYKLAEEDNYTLIRQGTTSIDRQAIGLIDPSVLADGAYEYKITAADTSNNTHWLTFTLTVRHSSSGDTVPPSVELLRPEHGDILSGIVEIAGTAEDETALASYQLKLIAPDNTEIILATGNSAAHAIRLADWDTTTGQDGIYRLVFSAADSAGNEKFVQISVYVNNRDSLAPRLEFITPKHADTVSGLVPIRVSVSDDSGIASYELAIKSADQDDFTAVAEGTGPVAGGIIYDWNTRNATDGVYSLRLTAEDTDDNYAWLVISVATNNAGPGQSGAAQLLVNNGLYYADIFSAVPIRIVADDVFTLSSAVITVNGTVVPNDGLGFASFVAATPGLYEVAAEISDKSGGHHTLTTEFRAIDPNDYLVPAVEIKSPANNAVLISPADIIGTVTAAGLVRYTLEYAKADSDIYTLLAEGIRPVDNGKIGTFDITFLPDGVYKIRLTGYGANGHARVETHVSIQNRNDPPYLEFVTPAHGDAVRGIVPIRAIITDMRNITSYELAIRGGSDADFTAVKNGNDMVEGDVIFNWDTSDLPQGPYALRLTARNTLGGGSALTIYVTVGEGISSDTLELIVNDGLDYADIDTSIPVQVIAGDNYDLSSLVIRVNANAIPAAANGTASFTANQLGLYVVTARIRNRAGAETVLEAQIRIVDPSDTRHPDVEITSPPEGAVLTAPTDIMGFVTDNGLVRYTLQYALAGSSDYTMLAEGVEPINGKLAVFDPTLLENGFYQIKLTGYGARYNISDEIVVSVEGDMKLGHFSIEFSDMDLPLRGFPLTINRTYDSRSRKRSDDFGYGWQMSFSGVKLTESCDPSRFWSYASRPGGPFGVLPTYYWVEEKPHEVLVDWGNGRTEKFSMNLGPAEQMLYPFTYDIYVTYTGIDTTSTLEPVADSRDLIFSGSLLTSWLQPYRPTAYRLTTEDGTVYIISATGGVERITDPLGNVITIDRNGIRHSDGNSIAFARDAHNRITKITGPAGLAVSYRYDDAGNLSAFTDISNEVTTFTYNHDHFLIETFDPRGIRVARNEYDDSGRLVAVVDASGKRMRFDNDIDGRRQVVTDRLGNSTLYVYDDRGHVLSKTDALGHTTYNEYDANGNLKSETDALGNVTAFIYSADGKLLSRTDALGNKTESTYHSKGQLATVKNMDDLLMTMSYDKIGNITEAVGAGGEKLTYDYNAQGLLHSLSDDIGVYMQYTYDGNGNVRTITDGEGGVVSFTYDESGNMLSRTQTRSGSAGVENYTEHFTYNAAGKPTAMSKPDGTTVRMSYNSIGKLASATDENGNLTKYSYDMFGNLETITYQDNTTETFVYDAEGRNTEITNRLGRTLKLDYDAVGNLISKEFPNGSTVRYEYDAAGRLLKEIAANGGVTEYAYDKAGRNTSVTDALGHKTEYGYDSMSRMVSMTDARGNLFRYEYDASGNKIKTVMPDETFLSSAYDVRGRLTSSTDQNGYTTAFEYDAADRLIAVTDAEGGKWDYRYDDAGNLISVTDANRNTTGYAYDNHGRVIKTTNALGHSAASKYDEKTGSLVEHTDYEGRTTKFSYDPFNRMTKRESGAETTAYTYTVDGKLESTTDASGTTLYEYDLADGLTSIRFPDGIRIDYRYDLSGNIVGISTLDHSVTYAYDKLNRLVSAVDANGQTEYAFDANGNVSEVKYPTGWRTVYTFDSLNRLTAAAVYDGASVNRSYSYTLGNAGERLGVNEEGRTTVYTYDKLYRLTSETVTSAAGTSVVSYAYDAASNRVRKVDNGTTSVYAYNELNQLTKETTAGAVTDYTYDRNGNLVSERSADIRFDYVYNNSDRLVSVTKEENGETIVESYRYDPFGNRIEKTTAGVTTRYVVDINGALAQVIAEINPAGTRYYTRGLALINMSAEDEIRYFLYDGHGDVRLLTDRNGTITDTYAFDAYGNLTTRTGDTDNPYLYCGERYDGLTGLYYLRARYMDPSTGTFLSMDTYPGDMHTPASLHKYLYAHANPVMYNDPTGQFIGMAMSSISMSTIINIQTTYYSYMFRLLEMSADHALKTAVGRDPGLPVPLQFLNMWIEDIGSSLVSTIVEMGTTDNSFGGETTRLVVGFLLGGLPEDGLDLLGMGVSFVDWFDKLSGNRINDAFERLLGVNLGSISSILGTIGDFNNAMVKLRALATIYGAGSPGILFVRTLNALIEGESGAVEEFAVYIKYGIFDSIRHMTGDLIAAYFVSLE